MQNNFKYFSGIIYVHFPESNKHGCDEQCSFCPFSKINYNIEFKPTDEEIIKFISQIEPNSFVQISSPGDPLYNFEKNKDYLVHVIDLVKLYGYKVWLTTKDFKTVAHYWETLLSKVDLFSLSCEEVSDEFISLIQRLSEAKKVRVTKLYNTTNELTQDEFDSAQDFIKYFNEIELNKENFQLYFRLNMKFNNYSLDTIDGLKFKFYILTKEYGYKISIGQHSVRKQLWNGQEVPGWELLKVAYQDMGLELDSEE